MKVPFGDLRREGIECGAKIRAGIDRVLESGWFILGKELDGFETAFSAYLGNAHVVGVGSGTEALHLALMAGGVEPGDFVVTVPNTAVPTVSAISAAGATPLLVDVDDASLTMDPAQLRRLLEREKPKLGRRLKAVVPVHLYGRIADMDRIVGAAKEFDLTVIEDAAQAHGAVYGGPKAGTIGDFGAFSFYPSKNLGCYGDGGAVVTRSAADAERLRIPRDQRRQQPARRDPGCRLERQATVPGWLECAAARHRANVRQAHPRPGGREAFPGGSGSTRVSSLRAAPCPA
jgi:dTDP-4-amino-4,6-dideoxygalactose transaminase